MKKILFTTILFLVVNTVPSWSAQGLPSTEEQIATLKSDVLAGKLAVGKTRLYDFVRLYGDAPSVTSTEKSVIVEFPGLKIEFEKTKYWKSWQYDSSRTPVYTKDVDKLRKDLESQKLVGENITFAKVRKDYGEPTASFETIEDGDTSTYFYGDIKMVFENRITLKKYEGKNLVEVSKGPATPSVKAEIKPVAVAKPAVVKPVAPKTEMPKEVVVTQKIESSPATK